MLSLPLRPSVRGEDLRHPVRKDVQGPGRQVPLWVASSPLHLFERASQLWLARCHRVAESEEDAPALALVHLAGPHRQQVKLPDALENEFELGAIEIEHIARGNYAEAIELFKSALQGQFSNDTALLHGLARAQFLSGDCAGAEKSLVAVKEADRSAFSADAHLLYARALEGEEKLAEASEEYERLVRYYPGEEARARFGLLLENLGRTSEANKQFQEILRSLDGAPTRYRRSQKEWEDLARRYVK